MPRATNVDRTKGPTMPPDDDAPDTGAGARQKISIVPAGSAPPVQTTAAASIFAAGEAAKPKPEPKPAQSRPYRTLNVAAVQIKTGVPLPPASTGITPVYKQLWDRMPVGSMVELPKRQAPGLAAHCKKAGAKYAIRTLADDLKGVWRLA